MKDLRCLVVDDEPLAIDVVVNYLHRLDIRAITRCDNGIDAFRRLQQEPFDLLFLDIEMPQLTGFDLLKSLPHRPLVIITTAYRDYAVEGFEWEVLDYLVKPFSFPRFMQTMEKILRVLAISSSDPATTPRSLPAPAAAPPDEKDALFLKTDRQWVRIDIADIQYVESMKDYIRVVTTKGEFICHQSLADITTRLPAEFFCRVHRSYTVALKKIDHVRHHCAHIGAKVIPISRANREEVYRRLGHSPFGH